MGAAANLYGNPVRRLFLETGPADAVGCPTSLGVPRFGRRITSVVRFEGPPRPSPKRKRGFHVHGGAAHNPRLRFGLQFGPLAPCSENQRVLVAINPRGPYAAVSLERHEVLCKTACLTDTHWWQNGASPLEDVKSYGECSRGKAL